LRYVVHDGDLVELHEYQRSDPRPYGRLLGEQDI
jgi:hypothetical protein